MERRKYFRERSRRNYIMRKPAFVAFIKVYPLSPESLPEEEWRPIPGYENSYHESNYGRTKSLKNGAARILKPALSTNGYLFVVLQKDGVRKNFRVSRLVATCFLLNPDNKVQVDHIDNNKFNNHVDNLRWVSGAENQQYALETGARKSGEEHGDAKLTNEQVVYVRDNPDGLTCLELAEMMAVSKTTIKDVQRGKKYPFAGGLVREKIENRVPDSVREAVRSLYIYGDSERGIKGLSAMFGLHRDTIYKIIHEEEKNDA